MSERRTYARPALQELSQSRLRRIRMQREVSSRHVALESGVGVPVYRRLEDGDNPDLSTISVASLVRVADCLRVSIGDFFEPSLNAEGEGATETGSDPAARDTDAATLGALLQALQTQASAVALADSLNWTQERLQSATRQLDEALAPAGLLVFQESGRVQIRARDEAHQEAETRFRQHPRATRSQRLDSRRRASLIAQAHKSPIGPNFRIPATTSEVNLLLGLGVLVDSGSGFAPSGDVTYSLYPAALDDTPAGLPTSPLN
ncbi:helix-turn-helix domain-containing protein [Nocardioides ochotonae]|uniref:helix-turn-helix domain-containing protein n=1 Tax=Nocardioides ochotonae TaxID=2685869 RepID=UPI001407FCC7|nr:helix-turn-helix transcriptional regulator [Nocardioides ochotonae]